MSNSRNKKSQKADSSRPINQAARMKRPTQDEQLFESPGTRPPHFTETDTWRVLRIMGEFTSGFEALAEVSPAISIFGSARVKPENPQYQAAVDTARLLGEAGFNIITGGGPGIMEAGNKGAQEADVLSIGLNIELPFEQGLNPYADIDLEFHYFFVRKTMFLKYSQGFVIFPGGFGTMDELFESLTLIQTGKVQNFPVVLYESAYWQGLFDWLQGKMLVESKIAQADLDLLTIVDTPEEVRDFIVQCHEQASWRRAQEEGARRQTRRVVGTGE